MDADTVESLMFSINGLYGSEERTIDGRFEEWTSFWQALADRYPAAPKLLGILGEVYLMWAGEEEQKGHERWRLLDRKGKDLMVRMLRADPWLASEFDLRNLLAEDPRDQFEYLLAELGRHCSAGRREQAQRLAEELLQEYGNDAEAVQRITSLLTPQA